MFTGFYDLLRSDTESLVYNIKHKNVDRWLFENDLFVNFVTALNCFALKAMNFSLPA